MAGLSVLVTGSLNGKVAHVLERVESFVCKHGRPFDAWFCLGDMLSPSMSAQDRSVLRDLISGARQVPMPVYFVLRDRVTGMDGELLQLAMAPTAAVQILEPTGAIKLASGLKVGYLSGLDRSDDRGSAAPTTRTPLSVDDVARFEERVGTAAFAGEVDVLLTFEWPTRICEHSASAPPGFFSLGSRLLASLLTRIRARYHLAIGENLFFEREPFENFSPRGDLLFTSRFISLAHAGSEQKWFYAFNIVPLERASAEVLHRRAPNATVSPFTAAHSLGRSALPDTHAATANYFFAIDSDLKRPYSAIEADAVAAAQLNAPAKRPPPPEGYLCKRCRSSLHYYRDCPHQETLPAGSEAAPKYICHRCHQPGHHIRSCPRRHDAAARAGAGSVDRDPAACWFCLANPAIRKHLIVSIGEAVYLALARGGLTRDHLIIIPIEHVPGTAALPAAEGGEEVQSYKEALAAMHKGSAHVPVFFLLQQNPAHHWHQQCIPVPQERAPSLPPFLLDYSARMGFPLERLAGPVQPPAGEEHFSVEIGETHLTYRIPQDSFFPAQFGRQALAEFLQLRDREDWRSAALPEEDEVRIVAEIKDAFKPFDPASQ